MSRRLLLADDSVTIQKVIEITLADKDYVLRIASDGNEALQMASNETPDLILADVFMPGKDGYEVCSAVRSDPDLKDIPVLLLAGTFEPFDKDKAKAVGANDWIVKPFSSQALVDKIEELLAQSPRVESWQATPSTAPADQDILQALEEVTAGQPAQPPVTSVSSVDSSEPAFEPQSFDVASQQATAATIEPDVLPAAADAGNFEEMAPFAGFDMELEDTPVQTSETEESSVPEVAEEFHTVDFDSGEVETTTDSSVDPFAAAQPQAVVQSTPAESSAVHAAEFSFNVESEVEVDPEPVVDLPPLEEFRVAQPQPNIQPMQELTSSTDDVLDLRESDIAEEGAYGAVPDRVEKRVAFLSDEQLTEIVERVAGAVIQKLAVPVVEQVVWEVVPDLAESMVREEIARLKPEDG
ncbi:MAG: hypothetical protein B6I36_06275 [Desulfobacteraceae bacterium 4572_35.1]|nr:MAG: hypothetical protein B6I36_06275 [Desulfobacteraceae bacterium 4572_35.1]